MPATSSFFSASKKTRLKRSETRKLQDFVMSKFDLFKHGASCHEVVLAQFDLNIANFANYLRALCDGPFENDKKVAGINLMPKSQLLSESYYAVNTTHPLQANTSTH